ncbi:MAG: glycoside hydrolase family 9 protein, partial [Oscillospiraceae bacterium]|nr:glycoside hydrolase family 9 protein [Oscillospiraceae bacterium]
TGLATRPWNYDGPKDQGGWETKRIVKPPTFAATLNFVACAAQAARLWQDIDPDQAQKYYDAAVTSYAAFKEHFYEYDKNLAGEDGNGQPLYAPMDQAIGGGAYGDDNVKDDAYWAACELYAASKAFGKDGNSYYNDLKGYSDAFKVLSTLEGGENNGSFGSFNWGNTASLGSLSRYLNGYIITSSELETIKDSIVDASELYIAKENEQGYGIPYQGTTFTDPVNIGDEVVTGFEWGSNSFAVNNAMVMAYAYDITGDKKHINGVSTAMDYILGRNPLSVSYVTGYGSYHISRPHHRYWSNELDSTLPVAPDGVMSGGPGAGLQDPYIQALGFKRNTLPSERCYVDSIEAW